MLKVHHPTKSGKAVVMLRETAPSQLHPGKPFEVTILDGHELLPGTKRFSDLDAARSYANTVWATR